MPDTRLRESETVEFKENWGEAALECIAAFANHRGGSVWLGLRDDGAVVGASDSDSAMRKISEQIVDRLGLRPSIQRHDRDGNPVIEITVQPSADLTACRGRYLTRVGSTNREMTQDQIVQQLLQRSGQTWDALPMPAGATEPTIETDAIRPFLRLAHDRAPALKPDDPVDLVLANLGLLVDGRLRRAAVLLFGVPEAVFPSARVRVGRFRAGQIVGDHTISGGLFSQLEGTIATLRNLLEIRQDIHPAGSSLEDLQRSETWQYPLEALREALVNALVHRDYGALGDIQVRVEDEQLAIWSPGLLPAGITPADLSREGHLSRRRNGLVATVFHLAGLVERWGTGTTRMIAACIAQGLPPPAFVEIQGGVQVTFRADPWTPDHLRALGLNARQSMAVSAVRRGGNLSSSDYQQLTGSARQTAVRDLDGLVRAGVFQRTAERGRFVRYTLASAPRFNDPNDPPMTHQ
ncbi:MAG: ATP-binding protein [Dehalococcoidia bacterium]